MSSCAGPPVVFAPTGLAFGARQVHVFRHRDGRHGEHIAVRDDLGMMTQLGHLPPSPRAAWRMARAALTGYRARAAREGAESERLKQLLQIRT